MVCAEPRLYSFSWKLLFRGTEGDIVIGVGVERRIEVDQINGFIFDVLA